MLDWRYGIKISRLDLHNIVISVATSMDLPPRNGQRLVRRMNRRFPIISITISNNNLMCLRSTCTANDISMKNNKFAIELLNKLLTLLIVV